MTTSLQIQPNVTTTIENGYLVIRVPYSTNGKEEHTAKPDFSHYWGATQQFLKELKDHYGTRVISRNDNFLKSLIWKHKISALSQLLKNMESRGLAVVDRNPNCGIHGKINSFVLNF